MFSRRPSACSSDRYIYPPPSSKFEREGFGTCGFGICGKWGFGIPNNRFSGGGLTGMGLTGKGPNSDSSCAETRRPKNANKNKIPATFFINRVLQKWLGIQCFSLCEFSDAGGREYVGTQRHTRIDGKACKV